MKKIIAVLLSVLLTAASASSLADDAYRVGICQFTQHEALDQASQGFMDGLSQALGESTVSFDMQNASGDSSICIAIINQFVADEVDLILANATASLHAAVASTGEIPILGTSVTEYGGVLGIEDFNGIVGGNVSGTSDLAPLDKQAEMIPELFPEAQTVGLLYCSAEPNSQYQIETVSACLEELGLTPVLYPFADSNEMHSVVQQAAEQSEVLYIPTDNTVAANAGIVDNICQPAGIPVVTGDTGTCRGAGVAVLGISYYDLGVITANMAAKVLRGEADISTMPIAYAENVTHHYNPDICEALGVNVPAHYTPLPEE